MELPPGQRVKDRQLGARVMALLRVKMRTCNLFCTTKIICLGETIHVYGALRLLSAARHALDTPGDCAAAPTRRVPRPRQWYTSAGVRRLPIVSAAATR